MPPNDEHEDRAQHDEGLGDAADLYPLTSVADDSELPPDEVLRRAYRRRVPLLFRAKLFWSHSYRPSLARSWRRVSDPEEDWEVGAEPLFEGTFALPVDDYVELIGPPTRTVVVTHVHVEPADDERIETENLEWLAEVAPLQEPVAFGDLLVDGAGRSRLIEKELPSPAPRRGDETKRANTDLRLIRCFMQLLFWQGKKELHGSAKEPNLGGMYGRLKKAGERVGLEPPPSRNTVMERLNAAMAVTAGVNKDIPDVEK